MKKKCLDEQTLWEYLDNEVDEPTLLEIENHLQKCKCCQEAYLELELMDVQFSKIVQSSQPTPPNANSSEPTNSSATHADLNMPVSLYQQYKGIIWLILSLLTILSVLSALAFVALIAPNISALPYSGEFKFLKTLSYKSLEIFLNSSMLLGFIFLGLFVWNFSYNTK